MFFDGMPTLYPSSNSLVLANLLSSSKEGSELLQMHAYSDVIMCLGTLPCAPSIAMMQSLAACWNEHYSMPWLHLNTTRKAVECNN